MADVFVYNNGSLLQAIKPAQNLHPLDDQPWAGQLDPLFAESSKSDGKLYGGPYGTAFGGGVLYNIPLYKKLGLEVPKTWDEFMANNEKVKADGSASPVEQTYGETWTSQLFVLGDFHNVAAAVPTFAADYTANKAKYATTPEALAGFENMQKVKEAGYFNKDFASAKLNDGIKAVATGTAAHYPMLGGAADGIETVAPGKSNDVGFFALPGNDAATNGMTVWPGTAAMYIPKTVEGDKLEAVKKFIAFAATQEGCDAVAKGSAPQGPFVSNGLQAAGGRLAGREGHSGLLRRRQGQPRAGVPVAGQGPGAGADHRPGRHRPGDRQGGRGALRPGRQEASSATRLAGLGVRAVPELVEGPRSTSAVVGHSSLKSDPPAAGLVRDRRQDPTGFA